MRVWTKRKIKKKKHQKNKGVYYEKNICLLLVSVLVTSCALLVGCKKEESVSKKANEVASVVDDVATQIQNGEEGISKALETAKNEVSKAESEVNKAVEDASKAMNKKPPKKPTVHGNGVAGVWEFNQKDYKIPATYTFKKDGTGQYNLAGQIKKLTWKTKGNQITITFKGEPDMNQKYKLKGDVLTLYDITDSPVVYYRVG